MKKRGLGRNIEILLGRTTTTTTAKTKAATTSKTTTATAASSPATTDTTPPIVENELRHLPIDILQRGHYQPRKDFTPEALQELADSIRTQGIIQPIIVRSVKDGRYEIIAGERRWRAAQMAGLTEIPALVKEIPDDAALAISIIENIQRESLNPLEEANAFQRLLDEFGLTHQEVANAVGKSRATVTNLMRLLTLHPDVKLMLEQGKIEMGHARALLSLHDIAQSRAAHTVVARNLSVRETEQLVRKLQSDTPADVFHAPKKSDPNITRLQQQLTDQLGALVMFKHSAKGKGKMIIHYSNLPQLEGILAHIQTQEKTS